MSPRALGWHAFCDTVPRESSRAATAEELETKVEENPMLWTIIAILLVLWLLGLIGNIGGGLIWLLLVIAAIVLVFQLLSGRRAV